MALADALLAALLAYEFMYRYPIWTLRLCGALAVFLSFKL
jgi:hypothetical protein